ncbi:zinc ribbon domain-containing protein [Wenzhouxiangella marina]|uniref:Uncharacterized protein n=1 Tax=Wenzhouxiangella marina TaxID=1579979 RepID=A0A0K0XZG9_9GAMM|nr:zinc ribbon domain-containing protein [Wenzhouxiangella marina]AKS43065.1 hypothetical protein WM2015_2707 [Wenzhouxiangella marina]MBB6087251.1 hypothetical protein [Wenzhouxiangella marina]
MALIRCPHCHKRISNRVKACPHCDEALVELSPEELERLASRRYKRQRFLALNLSYLGLTLLVFGAIWWYVAEPQGWVLPPPLIPVAMIVIGAADYVAARAWMLWLGIQRRRSG